MDELLNDLHIFMADYWPHLAVVLSVCAGATAAIHAAMTKRDVRAAIGWVALALFSPLFGAFFYMVAGVNRVRYTKMAQQRDAAYHFEHLEGEAGPHGRDSLAPHLHSLRRLGDAVGQYGLAWGNRIEPLQGGDEAYPRMLQAIREAKRSIALGSYIFDNDPVGRQFVEALAQAQARGVAVRVLIDSIGARYSRPSITKRLRRAGLPVALFMSDVLGLRLAYANLRSHRKLLIIDNRLAFTGGMNIRAGFMREFALGEPAQDAHFWVEGPVVSQLMAVFAHDWEFTTRERLPDAPWFVPPEEQDLAQEPAVPIRVVASGPDRNIGHTHQMLLGVLSVAREHVRLQTPYFLPDIILISAMTTAAMRGVQVDVVIPDSNNLQLVDHAMMAQLDQLITKGVRVWRTIGSFDHAKLLTVDGTWSYVGSSNCDSRSLRLNFELDLEVHDRRLASWIEERIDGAIGRSRQVTLESLRAAPFWVRLRNRIIWLASPYL